MKFLIVFLMIFPTFAMATSAQLLSPTEGIDISNKNVLEVQYKVTETLNSGDRFVVFRKNNNWWNRVQEVEPQFKSVGTAVRLQNLTPGFYFCKDVYAIRLMRGAVTLAGPVHFTAGAGACEGPNDKFVNLEKNQVDLPQFSPANQGSRDTCGSFAGVAALESAYKRLKNVSLRFSQHYMHHIIKSSWLTDKPFYKYENQTSYWGGNDTLTALKFMKWYPLPLLQYAPYQNQDELTALLTTLGLPQLGWNGNPALNATTQDQIDKFEYAPANISQTARANAYYGAEEYVFHSGAEAKDTARIENYLKSGKEVMVALLLKWRSHPTLAKTMYYDAAVNGGAHLMLIVGFDRTGAAPYFLVKNSWGDGVIRMHYDIIKNTTSSIGVITKVKETHWVNPSHWIGKWEMKHDNWPGKLFIRRNYEVNLDRINDWNRLGEYQDFEGKSHCIWGNTTEGGTKLKLWIDFDSTIQVRPYNIVVTAGQPAVRLNARDVCPKEKRGQYFEITLPSRNSTTGTGTTWWDNRPFPVKIWK